jgi:anion-transporting  ArsA/GET3 family ATPase
VARRRGHDPSTSTTTTEPATSLDVSRREPRQLHFVTGKGGVGKSLVACALARRFVDDGDRVLLAQVHARDSHAALLGLGPVDEDLREVGPRLSVVNLLPAQAMREYALMTLKVEAVYRAVFENRVTKTFLRFVPSLDELVMMGKLWFHAEETDDGGRPRFERIVIDCPSTGHALKLFSIARVITETLHRGPMVEKTRQMAAVFADPSRTAAHLVTLPEELPVNETLELLSRLHREQTVPLGHVVINATLPRLFDDRTKAAFDQVASAVVASDSVVVAIVDVGRRRRIREEQEAAQRARLLTCGRPLIDIPHLQDSPLLPDHVARVARLLDDVN